MVSDKKIALLGLDNAGKSSIVISMQKRFNIPTEIQGLKPTLKVSRSSFQFMDHIIYVNDFGGQENYLDMYLKDKVRYLADIDLVFFVIDIQDSLKFNKLMEFFEEIAKFYLEFDKKVPFAVLFHKFDPKLQKDPAILKNQETLMEKFRPYMSKLKIRIFHTNIFNIQSIISAFSNGMKLIYSQQQVLQKFIDDIVDRMEDLMALLLFEQNGIELASYLLENVTISMQKKIIALYEIAQFRINAKNTSTFEFTDRLDQYTKVSGVIKSFEIEGLQFYVVLIVQEHDPNIVINQFNYFETVIPDMIEVLKPLLLDDEQKTAQLNPQ
ncbi:MAG: ADP-ribosylation factor-like protein [Promethearchaeota archaeon]